jgi:hypothetical protein
MQRQHFEQPSLLDELSATSNEERQVEHIMDTEGLSAYEARAKVVGYFPVQEQVSLHTDSTAPEEQNDLETIGRLQRLEIMKQDHGFYPTSLRELSEAFTVTAFDTKRGGAAKHLAEIARHQEKYDADPVKAAVSVTTEFGLYAQQARTDATALLQLKDELSVPDAHQFSAAEPLMVTGRGLVARFIDLKELAALKGAGNSEFDPLTVVSGYRGDQPTAQMAAHIRNQLKGLRLAEAKAVVDGAVSDQRARFDFWTQQVAAIRRHNTGASRIVATNILNKLHATAE